MPEANVVMMAYREFDSNGARLLCKILLLNEGNEVWQDAQMIRSAVGGECKSYLAPALVAVGKTFYCAYTDNETKKLLCVSADASNAIHTGLWSGLVWSEPEEITPTRPGTARPPEIGSWRLGPSLAAFAGGLYCLYVDNYGELRCAARLRPYPLEENHSGIWIPIDLDQRRFSDSTPALVVFNGQLKCAYRDGNYGLQLMLAYTLDPEPERGPRTGTWRAEGTVDIQADAMALAQWETSVGPRLVALGRGPGQDWNLRYAVSTDNTRRVQWGPEVRTTALASSEGPALVTSGGGTVLHGFYTRETGSIDWITAR
jgi:hypothetical protein